jgi:hypothetical protein
VEVPTSPSSPCRDGCSGVEACGEANTATGACSLDSRLCYGWGCVYCGIEGGVPTVGLVKYVGWRDPFGRNSYRLAAYEKLQRFFSLREDLVGAAVRGLQSPACCVLMEKDMHAVI